MEKWILVEQFEISNEREREHERARPPRNRFIWILQFPVNIILVLSKKYYGNSNETISIDHKYDAQSHRIQYER